MLQEVLARPAPPRARRPVEVASDFRRLRGVLRAIARREELGLPATAAQLREAQDLRDRVQVKR